MNPLTREYPGNVRACFIGYDKASPNAKLKQIREFTEHPNDWVSDYSDQQVLQLIEEMIDFSKYLVRECSKFDIRYFDQSEDFRKTAAAVLSYLADGLSSEG